MSTASFKQALHALTLISQKDPTLEGLNSLYQSGLLSDLLEADPSKVNREELRKSLGLTPLELLIVVNYGQPLNAMIVEGSYDWVNDDITAERFPIVGEGRVELKAHLIHFNRVIGSDDVEKELEKMGKRPGKIEELLAFGRTYPEMQRKFPILALGSVARIRGVRFVPYLSKDGSERELDLDWRDSGGWDEYCRFLAFDK